jgi:hypothetical protein
MGLMTVHVMNIYTGDVFVNSLSFHSKNISKRLEPLDLSFTFSNKLLVGLMSYYKGLQTEKVLFKGVNVDLIKNVLLSLCTVMKKVKCMYMGRDGQMVFL